MTPRAAKIARLERYGFRDFSFPQQDNFVADKAKFIAAQCSRRAGKSTGLALRFLNTLAKHPGCFCPYVALTRESARNIMWPVLQQEDERFKIGLIFTDSNLTVTHPNGARLQLFGADMKNFIRRLKGIKTPGAAIDEAQDFGVHIESLIDDVLTPALTDYKDSWLAVAGTPGPVPLGYFYDISACSKYGFSLHKWTLLDNPYLPDAPKFIEELKAKRGWDDNNPTLQREWRNNWILDESSLLIKYSISLNDYDRLPNAKWTYILGVDIGLRDADALAVLGWTPSSRDIYLVEELTTKGQDITTLSNQIEHFIKKYEPSKIVMDEGALGKKIAEELRRRRSLPIHAADKARKMENVAFLNDYLRLGRFKAKRDSLFAQDSYRLQIDWEHSSPDKIKVKDTFHSDIIDSVLYAFKESPAYTYKEAEIKPKYGSKEWAEEETRLMEKQAQEHFEALEDITKAQRY